MILPIKYEDDVQKLREKDVHGVTYRMSSNVNTVIDGADNHFIIVKEKRSMGDKKSSLH